MSRKKIVKVFDPVKEFEGHDVVIEKLVNKIMWDGKRSVAKRIVREAMEKAGQKLGCTPDEALKKAMDNVRPLLEVKSRRVGGATYQVPVEVTEKRANQLAIRWIVDFARSKSGKSMSDRLAAELVQAAHNEGNAVKKREDTHRMADANKAFAHYRW